MENHPRHVLVLEDEILICELLKVAILDAGGTPVFAHSVAEGMDRIKEIAPDLFVIDIGLPDGDGRDFVETIRGLNPDHRNKPVIYLTGRGDRATKVESYSKYAIDYILKPFSILELTLKIRNLLYLFSKADPSDTDQPPVGQAGNSGMPPNDRLDASLIVQRVRDLCFKDCDDPDYSISDAAEALNMSVRTIQRRLQSEGNQSFSKILMEMRMAKACSLLLTYSIKEVAVMCGYRYLENFTSAFKRIHGIPPGQYQANLKNQGNS